MANLVTFAKKLWKDATSGNTPITAAELNRMEKGISDCATQINKLGDSVSRVIWDESVSLSMINGAIAIGACGTTLFSVFYTDNKPYIRTAGEVRLTATAEGNVVTIKSDPVENRSWILFK